MSGRQLGAGPRGPAPDPEIGADDRARYHIRTVQWLRFEIARAEPDGRAPGLYVLADSPRTGLYGYALAGPFVSLGAARRALDELVQAYHDAAARAIRAGRNVLADDMLDELTQLSEEAGWWTT